MTATRAITRITDADDAAISAPAHRQGLIYNTTTGKWENAPLTAADLTPRAARVTPYYISGSWYGALNIQSSGGDVSGGSLRLFPWTVYETTTFVAIGANHFNLTAAGSLYRLAIFRDDSITGTLLFTLILDAGTIDLSTPTGRKSIGISQQLTPGLYWLGGRMEGTLSSNPRISRSIATSTGFGGGLPMVVQGFNANFTNNASGCLEKAVAGALATFTPVRADFENVADVPGIRIQAA